MMNPSLVSILIVVSIILIVIIKSILNDYFNNKPLKFKIMVNGLGEYSVLNIIKCPILPLSRINASINKKGHLHYYDPDYPSPDLIHTFKTYEEAQKALNNYLYILNREKREKEDKDIKIKKQLKYREVKSTSLASNEVDLRGSKILEKLDNLILTEEEEIKLIKEFTNLYRKKK